MRGGGRTLLHSRPFPGVSETAIVHTNHTPLYVCSIRGTVARLATAVAWLLHTHAPCPSTMSQSSPQGKRTKLSDISPEDLERAAKYLRELDASNNAKAAFELAKREQDVEIAKESARGKEADAQRAGAASQFERVRGEEQRRSMEAKRDNEKVRRGCATRRRRRLCAVVGGFHTRCGGALVHTRHQRRGVPLAEGGHKRRGARTWLPLGPARPPPLTPAPPSPPSPLSRPSWTTSSCVSART